MTAPLPGSGRRWHAAALLGLALSAGGAEAAAQAPPDGVGRVPGHEQATAEPVPREHWVYDLLDGLTAVGATGEAWLPGSRPVPLRTVLRALRVAEEEGGAGSASAGAARAWLEREYRPHGGRPTRVVPAVDLDARQGRGADRTLLGVGAEGSWSPARSLTLFAEPRVELDAEEAPGLAVPRWGGVWIPDPLVLTVGRDRPQLGRGARGGILVSDVPTLSGVSIRLARPLEGRGLAAWLGRVDGSLSVSRIPADEWGPTSLLVLGEARLRPHPRVQIGLHRAIVATGEVEGEPIGPTEIGYILIGKHTGYDDQRASISASVRVTAGPIHLLPYLELGIEDTAGLDEDPGLILGLRAPLLPVGTVPLGLGYEYVGFGRHGRFLWGGGCCFEPRNWYRHSEQPRRAYLDDQGELIGHPLGGYGHEHRVEAFVPAPAAGVVGRIGVVARVREERNLRYGLYPGSSRVLYARLSVLRGPLSGDIGAEVERGSAGWSRGALSATLRWIGPDPR